MEPMTQKLTAILAKYMRDPAANVAADTTLRELEIDRLDLPMILLDIEDSLDVRISYDDEIEHFSTFGEIVGCVAAHLEAKSRPRVRTLRIKRSWISTTA